MSPLPRLSKGKEKPASFGFDALEKIGENLVVYHYRGLDWDGRTYAFLESIDSDWQTVRKYVGGNVWSWIARARNAGRFSHVVAFDPTTVSPPKGAVATAAARYGIPIVVRSLFDV